MRVGLTISTLLLASAALHADAPRTPISRPASITSREMIATTSQPSYMIEFSDTLQLETPADVRTIVKKRSLPAQVVPGIQSAAHSAARFLAEKVLRLR